MAERIRICVDRERRAGLRHSRRPARCDGVDQRLPHLGTRVHPPRARGDEPEQIGMQVVVACRSGLLRRGDERLVALGVERARHCGLLDPGDPRAVQLAELQLARPRAAAATTTSRRPPSAASSAAASRRRLRLAGSPSSAARLSAVTATAMAPRRRARARCLPRARARRPRAPGEQRRAMPRAPVGLVLRVRRPAPRAHAGAAPRPRSGATAERISGCRNRIVCRSSVDDARVGGRRDRVEIHGGSGDGAPPRGFRRARRSSLSAATSRTRRVASGRSDTRAANARSRRSVSGSAAGHRLLVVCRPPGRKLEERERVSGRLAQDARARRERKPGADASSSAAAAASSRPASLCSGKPARRRAPRGSRRGRRPAGRSGRTRFAARRTRARRRSGGRASGRPRRRAAAAHQWRPPTGGRARPSRCGSARARPRASGRTRRRAPRAGRRGSSAARSRTGGAADAGRRTADAPRTARQSCVSTVMPRSRAVRAASGSRRDLPIPGSPRSTSAWPRVGTSSRSDVRRVCSSRRPNNG